MKTNWFKIRFIGVLLAGSAILIDGTANAVLTPNSWTNSVSSKWETPGNWSLNLAPSTNGQSAILITNATSKAVTIDATTTNTPTMTISNLTLSAPSGATNTLLLSDSGTNVPLRILNNFTLTAGGSLVISNGAVQVDNLNGQLLPFRDDGQVWLISSAARLVHTNGFLLVGVTAEGMMTVSNGTVLADRVHVARSAGSRGTLTIAGGTNKFGSDLRVGAGGTGVVWVTGGDLIVTNGPTTVGDLGVGQMTVSNGTVLATSVAVAHNVGGQGTLAIAGGTAAATGPLEIAANVGDSTGTVWVTGGQLVVTNTPGSVGAGSGFIVDGSVRLGFGGGFGGGGSIIVSNVNTVIGHRGSGSLTVSDGSVVLGNVFVGSNTTANGTITLAGGTTTVSGSMRLAFESASTGTLWITGGQFTLTNQSLRLASRGTAQMTLSNGTVLSRIMLVGDSVGSCGTLTVAGGTLAGPAAIVAGNSLDATGTVWVTGGVVDLNNVSFANQIGASGLGAMTVSNGLVTFRSLFIGNGGSGTLTAVGGTNSIYSDVSLGTDNCEGTGTVIVAGGSLFVTNGGTAVLEVRSGTFTLNSGTVVANQFVMTNACTTFIRTGGTLIYGSAVLDPNRDADGDGIPNGFEQAYGLDPLNAADANVDTDGDGLNNLQESLAGFNPTNSAARVRIINIATTVGTNVTVTYLGASGDTTYTGGPTIRTNVLESTTGTPPGFANTFVSTGQTNYLFGGTGLGEVATFVHTNGATGPARYYRVRLVP